MFEILFDTLTPRAHFIIKFNDSLNNRKFKRNLGDLENHEIVNMLELINQFIKVYNLNREQFILSFHTGCWVRPFDFDNLILQRIISNQI